MKILSVIIPVFNEKNTILEILKRVEAVDLAGLGFGKEIIVADDGSTDGTRSILRGLANKYKIIFHEKNRGKGAAIRTGLDRVSGDIVIIQDADLEYDPEDYKVLLKKMEETGSPAVYGSRNLNKNNKPSSTIYYWGGVFLSFITSLLYSQKITDEPTCYKMFKTEFLKSLNLKCERFEFCPEVTAKTMKKGIKIPEIPISYHPRSVKDGKKIKFRDALEAIFTLIKYRFVD